MPDLIGPLFDGLDDATLDAFQRSAAMRRALAGQALFHEEDSAENLILIVKGMVRVWRTSPRGAAMTVHLMGPGALPGCAALFRQHPYPASATALEPATTLTWPAERVREWLAACPALALNALGIVAAHTEEMLQRLHETTTQPVEQRVARAIVRMLAQERPAGAVAEIRLSRQALAELTGTTLHTVSRLVGRWERAGIVIGGRERIRILSTPELIRIGDHG